MALAQTAAGLAMMVLALPSTAQTFAVEIFNNTAADLCVDGKTQKDCIEIQPNSAARVRLNKKHWINFGMEALEYQLPPSAVRRTTGKSSSLLRLQVEPGGVLYVVPSKAQLPVRPLPTQPVGFPLKPLRVVDLT